MWTKQTKFLRVTVFSVGITILKQKIILKDDSEIVTEFPCLLFMINWVTGTNSDLIIPNLYNQMS